MTATTEREQFWMEPLHVHDAERFSTWLHDNVVQVFEYLSSAGYGQCESVEQMQELATDALNSLRTSLDSSTRLDLSLDLRTSLRSVIAQASVLNGIDVRVKGFSCLEQIDEATARCLLGAMREAVANCGRHSGAGVVHVLCRLENDLVRVTISDDGVGFDSRRIRPGFGLSVGINARMASVDGSASVHSSPGEGTVVTLIAPTHKNVGVSS